MKNMEKDIIIIDEQGSVIFPDNGDVWMTAYEITELFEVFHSAVRGNISAIFKSGVLCKENVCREIKISNGYVEEYNIEMIIALAFRIKSYNTEAFRNWLQKRLWMQISN